MANQLYDFTISEVAAVDRPANAEHGVPRARIALFKRDTGMQPVDALKTKVLKYLYPPLGNPADQPKARSFNDVYSQVEQVEEFAEMGEEFQERINALCQCAWLILADASVADKQQAINAAVDQFVASVKQGLSEKEEAEKLFEGGWDDQDEICKAVDGRTQGGVTYPKSDYAYTPDDTPSHWKLRLTSAPGGKPDARIVGAAVAALGKGYRGNKVQIPAGALSGVRAKVRRAWCAANPDKGTDQMPSVLKGESTTMTIQEIEKKLGDLEASTEILKAANAGLVAENAVVLKMSKKARKAFGSMTEEKRKQYMAADEQKRQAMVDETSKALKAAKPKDDEIEPDDDDAEEKEARKRLVAKLDAATAEAGAAKEQVTKAEARLSLIEKQNRLDGFSRMAETKLPHTSGSPIEKGELLMTLADTLPGGETGEVFKKYLGTLEVADKALEVRFKEIGKAGGEIVPAEKMIEAKAEEISKRDHITKAQAYEKAMFENPELYEQYDQARPKIVA